MQNIPIFIFLLLVSTSCQFNSAKKENYSASNTSERYKLQDELTLSVQRGESIYMDFCMTCHQPDGMGVENKYPPLANSDFLREQREESIRSVKYGQQGAIVVNGVTYNEVMAPMGLENDEVADVMNYVMNSWGNRQNKMVTVKEVSEVIK